MIWTVIKFFYYSFVLRHFNRIASFRRNFRSSAGKTLNVKRNILSTIDFDLTVLMKCFLRFSSFFLFIFDFVFFSSTFRQCNQIVLVVFRIPGFSFSYYFLCWEFFFSVSDFKVSFLFSSLWFFSPYLFERRK